MTTYEHHTVVGKLTRVVNAIADGGDAFYFEYKPDEFLALKFKGGWDDSHSIPFNIKIALCMSDVEIDGFRVVCSHQPYYTEVK